jgi:predicted dehydrogenase
MGRRSRALVVGRGSIGSRHARLLRELGCDVRVVSRRPGTAEADYRSIVTALADFAPTYVVLARETALHADDVRLLGELGFTGAVLVEKPLTAAPEALGPLPFSRCAVAYNLRWHPALLELRDRLGTAEVIHANAYVGQHLSSWRTGVDFRSTSSASSAMGGGVLRDLSHELDLLQWLMGPWRQVVASGGNSGALGIETDDAWGILLSLERCPAVTVGLSYLDRVGQRQLTVVTEDRTWTVDLVAAVLRDGRDRTAYVVENDDTYREQHLAMLRGDGDGTLCSLAEGARTVELVDAIERSHARGTWIRA